MKKHGNMKNEKTWKYEKNGFVCSITVSEYKEGFGYSWGPIKMFAEMEGKGEKIKASCKLKNGNAVFDTVQKIRINGKMQKIGGLKLPSNIYEEATKFSNEIVENLEKEDKEEYRDFMSGKRKLKISFSEGEYLSGYTAFGNSAKVIADLHCGHYVEGWGFLVDEEFADGNIEKMKRHFEEVENRKAEEKKERVEKEKAYEKEKEEVLKDVKWETFTSLEEDEGGLTKVYRHILTINKEKYIFTERNVFDFGRVIVPSVKLKGDELRAYEIVKKYGNYANAEIRM